MPFVTLVLQVFQAWSQDNIAEKKCFPQTNQKFLKYSPTLLPVLSVLAYSKCPFFCVQHGSERKQASAGISVC